MSSQSPHPADRPHYEPDASSLSRRMTAIGRAVALAGVILPLFMIGILKFTQYEIEALKPLISATPWLAWLYDVFGYAGTSYLLGAVEVTTAALFLVSPWSARAALGGGLLGSLTFTASASTMLAVPIWEPTEGGFPFLSFDGSFLIKDVALLGISLVVLGEALARNGIGTTRGAA